MSNDLLLLLESVPDPDADLTTYREAVVEGNCLGKRTASNRSYSFRYLQRTYGLSPDLVLFRALRYFCKRESAGQHLIVFLEAYARDPLLRSSAPYVLPLQQGTCPIKEDFEQHMTDAYPDRFGEKMVASLVRNLLSSWTQSGHLTGRTKKVRRLVEATPGSAAYALLLGYLRGVRGSQLFTTEYARLLDCSQERVMELAEDASRRGWIVLKRVGNVVEVLFPAILTAQELEWIREQN